MRKLSLILLGAAFGAGTMLIGAQMQGISGGVAQAASSDVYRKLTLFGDIFEKVRADYVEKPDETKLIDSAINGMLSSLDPHSTYLDAKSFKDMQVTTKGEFGGLGIEVAMEDGVLKVVSPIDDTPAAKGGVLSGDIISKIDGESVQGMALNAAVEKDARRDRRACDAYDAARAKQGSHRHQAGARHDQAAGRQGAQRA